ncbi:MAG TPA: NAD(P)H-hydrate dehydratase [Planctomycetes bacterium]|nr:NAD(P)H-hydrate dehydratase [Planctomycetota bacterium]
MRPPLSFPRRALDAHKNALGDVLVVAGSRGMAGAAFLAGRACLRTGAGLVTLACPESVQPILATKATCLMTRGLPETRSGSLAAAALEPLVQLAMGRTAIAIGPGLSQSSETPALVREFLARLADAPGGPRLVIDADALNALAGQDDLLARLSGRAVLTPHPGEFRRLAGDYDAERRGALLEEWVTRAGVATLLKGKNTLVVARGGDDSLLRYRNLTGNPGMATAGSGDVLTGVIAGLLAQGLAPFDAARLGAWLHGRAGDLVARRVGWAPLIATDLIDGLIEVIRGVEETK